MGQNEEQKTIENTLDFLKCDSVSNSVKQKIIEEYYQYKKELIRQANNKKSCKELFCEHINTICIVTFATIVVIVTCYMFENISTKDVHSDNNISKSKKVNS